MSRPISTAASTTACLEFAPDYLAALPTDWIREHFGAAVLPSVFSRVYLIMSLAELGRFAEAAKHVADAIRLAESTQHVFTVGWAYLAASMLELVKGDWVKAHAQIEQLIATLRIGNVTMHLPWAFAASAWELAQLGETGQALDRVQESERLLEKQAERGIVGHRAWAYSAAGRAYLLLGRIDEARRLGDLATRTSSRQPGSMAQALRLLGDVASHPEQFDGETAEAHYRDALALAERNEMRPLVAQCHLGLGKLYGHTGASLRARDHTASAMTMFRDMDMQPRLEQQIEA